MPVAALEGDHCPTAVHAVGLVHDTLSRLLVWALGLAAGALWVRQAVPFQCWTSGREVVPKPATPTAVHEPAVGQDTPRRKTSPLVVGAGGVTVHLAPFHRSMRAFSPVGVVAEPTAMQALGPAQATADSWMPSRSTGVVADAAHPEPSQCSTRASSLPLKKATPTAKQLSTAGQATP